MSNWGIRKNVKWDKSFSTWLLALLFPSFLAAQNTSDTLLQRATLDNCVRYAIQQNPDLKNAQLDEEIIEATIKSKLADWYPQIN